MSRPLTSDSFASPAAFPLKAEGNLWHTGWDIPTRWAVDADGVTYMDNGHGHKLTPVTQTELLSNAEDPDDANRIRRALGIDEVETPEQTAARLQQEIATVRDAVNVWLTSPQDDQSKLKGIRRVLTDFTYATRIAAQKETS